MLTLLLIYMYTSVKLYMKHFFIQIESIYKKAQETIRTNPEHKKIVKEKEPVKKRWNRARLSLSERKNRVAQKKASFLKTLEEIEA